MIMTRFNKLTQIKYKSPALHINTMSYTEENDGKIVI